MSPIRWMFSTINETGTKKSAFQFCFPFFNRHTFLSQPLVMNHWAEQKPQLDRPHHYSIVWLQDWSHHLEHVWNHRQWRKSPPTLSQTIRRIRKRIWSQCWTTQDFRCVLEDKWLWIIFCVECGFTENHVKQNCHFECFWCRIWSEKPWGLSSWVSFNYQLQCRKNSR